MSAGGLSVEQLELLRRLRSSGINAENVTEAFRALDSMEPAATAEPSPLRPTAYASPQLARQFGQLAQQQQCTSALACSTDLHQQQQRCAFTTVPESCVFGQTSTATTATATTTISTTTGLRPPSTSGNAPPMTTMATNAAAAALLSTLQQQFRPGPMPPVPSSAAHHPHQHAYGATAAARPIRSQRQPMKDITTLEDPNELEQFMAQGEEACIQDMKKFITQYSLRQTTVAQMTGVSQPYISKLLNGNHRELSLRCRRNIYAWYLNCRRHPAMYCQDPATRLETNGDGELVPQRRERYVFRPVLIRMLEHYFADSPFPDGNRRAEIAQACNAALQQEKRGAQLVPKEIVTPQVIANWFANKRKEMRRKSNEENRHRQLLHANCNEPANPASSPDGSTSSGFVESPGASSLLPPLQFPVPFQLLAAQAQQQQQHAHKATPLGPQLSIENLLEAQRPFLHIGNPLQELLQRHLRQQQQQQSSTDESIHASPLQLLHRLQASPSATRSAHSPTALLSANASNGSQSPLALLQNARSPLALLSNGNNNAGSPLASAYGVDSPTLGSPSTNASLLGAAANPLASSSANVMLPSTNGLVSVANRLISSTNGLVSSTNSLVSSTNGLVSSANGLVSPTTGPPPSSNSRAPSPANPARQSSTKHAAVDEPTLPNAQLASSAVALLQQSRLADAGHATALADALAALQHAHKLDEMPVLLRAQSSGATSRSATPDAKPLVEEVVEMDDQEVVEEEEEEEEEGGAPLNAVQLMQKMFGVNVLQLVQQVQQQQQVVQLQQQQLAQHMD